MSDKTLLELAQEMGVVGTQAAPPAPKGPQSILSIYDEMRPATRGERTREPFARAARGVVGTVGGISEGVALPLSAIPLVGGAVSSPFQWVADEAAKLAAAIPVSNKLADNFLLGDVPEAIGSTLPFLVGGLAAGESRLLQSAIPAFLGGTAQASGQYREAEAAGEGPAGRWASYALGFGVGTTEAVPIGHMLARINKATGGSLERAAIDMLIEGVEEFTQEGTQQYLGNLIAKNLVGYDEDRELLDGVVRNAAAGGLAGVFLSAVTTAKQMTNKLATPEAPPGAPPTPGLAGAQPDDAGAGPSPGAPGPPGAAPLASPERGTPKAPDDAASAPARRQRAAERFLAVVRDEGQDAAAVPAPTAEHQRIERFLAARGVETVWVQGPKELDRAGAYDDGVAILDASSTGDALVAATFHELAHHVRDFAGGKWEHLFDLVKKADPEGLQKALDAYAGAAKRAKMDPSEDLAAEESLSVYVEGLAGYIQAAMEDPAALARIAQGKNGRRLLDHIIDGLIRLTRRLGISTSRKTSLEKALLAVKEHLSTSPLSEALDPRTAAALALAARQTLNATLDIRFDAQVGAQEAQAAQPTETPVQAPSEEPGLIDEPVTAEEYEKIGRPDAAHRERIEDAEKAAQETQEQIEDLESRGEEFDEEPTAENPTATASDEVADFPVGLKVPGFGVVERSWLAGGPKGGAENVQVKLDDGGNSYTFHGKEIKALRKALKPAAAKQAPPPSRKEKREAEAEKTRKRWAKDEAKVNRALGRELEAIRAAEEKKRAEVRAAGPVPEFPFREVSRKRVGAVRAASSSGTMPAQRVTLVGTWEGQDVEIITTPRLTNPHAHFETNSGKRLRESGAGSAQFLDVKITRGELDAEQMLTLGELIAHIDAADGRGLPVIIRGPGTKAREGMAIPAWPSPRRTDLAGPKPASAPMVQLPTEPTMFGEQERAPKPRKEGAPVKVTQPNLLDIQEGDLRGQTSMLDQAEETPPAKAKGVVQPTAPAKPKRKGRGRQRRFPSGANGAAATIADVVWEAGGIDLRRGVDWEKTKVKRQLTKDKTALVWHDGYADFERVAGKEIPRQYRGVVKPPTTPKAVKPGLTPDEATEVLWQAGWESRDPGGGRPNINELAELLDDEINGGAPHYLAGQEPDRMTEHEARIDEVQQQQLEALAEELGSMEAAQEYIRAAEADLEQRGQQHKTLEDMLRENRDADELGDDEVPFSLRDLRYSLWAWHGSGAEFNEFSDDKIGSGEGNQAYGWGHYFASKREIAEWYKKAQSRTTRSRTTWDGKPITKAALDDAWQGSDRALQVLSMRPGWISLAAKADQRPKVQAYIDDLLEERASLQGRLDDRRAREGQIIASTWTEQDYIDRIEGLDSRIETAREALGRMGFDEAKHSGKLYKVELAPEDDEYLLWDAPLSQQSEKVRAALDVAYGYSLSDLSEDQLADDFDADGHEDLTGERLYRSLPVPLGDPASVSAALLAAGIRGNKYRDSDSRGYTVEPPQAAGHDWTALNARGRIVAKGTEAHVRSWVSEQESHNYVVFDAKDAKIRERYSLRALHNLSEENLLHAAEIGGLAMPSIAITTDEIGGIQGFGEITLIASPALVDPKKTPVFDSDIWSPRHPRMKWRHRPGTAAIDAILRRFDATLTRYGLKRWEVWSGLKGEQDTGPDPRANAHRWATGRSSPLKFVYAAEVLGRPVRRFSKQRKFSSAFASESKAFRDWARTADRVSVESIHDATHRALSDAVRAGIREMYVGDLEPVGRTLLAGNFDEDGFLFFGRTYRWEEAAKHIRDGSPRVSDTSRMEDLAHERAQGPAYEAWVAGLLDEIYHRPYVEVGRRKIDYSLDAAVEAMQREKMQGGEKGLFFTPSTLRGVSAAKIDTFEELRNRSHQLGTKDSLDAYIQDVQSPLIHAFLELAHEARAAGSDFASTMGAGEDALRAMGEAMPSGVFNPRRFERALRKYDFRTSARFTAAAREVARSIREAPAEYFEAKPDRSVSLDEFSGAVIPAQAKKAAELLRRLGLPYETYKGGTRDAARREATERLIARVEKSGTPIRFSLRSALTSPDPDELGFYSGLERAVVTKLQGKYATVDQVRALLKKGDVKQAEWDWAGMDAYLADGGNDQVWVYDLVQWIRGHTPSVEEEVQGAPLAQDPNTVQMRALAEAALQQLLDAGNERRIAAEALEAQLKFVLSDATFNDLRAAAGSPVDVAHAARAAVDADAGFRWPDWADRRFEPLLVAAADRELVSAYTEATDREIHTRQGEARLRRRLAELEGGQPAQFERYTFSGGTNYRVLLLRWPLPPAVKALSQHADRAWHRSQNLLRSYDTPGDMTDEEFVTAQREAREEYDRLAIELGMKRKELGRWQGSFSGGHFHGDDIFAHIRTKDRVDAQGRRILFIEEFQSDWRNKAFEAGGFGRIPVKLLWDVGPKNTILGRVETEAATHSFSIVRVPAPGGREDSFTVYEGIATLGTYSTLEDAKARAEAAATSSWGGYGPPPFPWANNWHELALKRVLTVAAANGYDGIAWATGLQQIDRFREDLRQRVERISWGDRRTEADFGDGQDGRIVMVDPTDGSAGPVFLTDAAGMIVEVPPGSDYGSWEPALGKNLRELLGREAAERILAEPSGRIEGEDLSLGGQGKRVFYDQMLPSAGNKIGKRYGARVAPMEVRLGESGLTQVHGLYLTDALTRSAIDEGFQRFALRNAMRRPHGSLTRIPGGLYAQGFDIPPESLLRNLRRRVQDFFEPVVNWEKAVNAQGGDANVVQPFRLWRGRAKNRVRHFRKRYVDPIVRLIHDNEITDDEIADFLRARHAEERNEAIRKIDPGNHSGSGMTDKEARALMAGFAAHAKAQAFERIGRIWDRMNQRKLQAMLADGLVTQEEVDALNAKYKHWAPLRTMPDEEIAFSGIGQGIDIRGKEYRRAMGRVTPADKPLEFGFLAYSTAIVRGEKNRVGQEFLEAVETNPDPSVARVGVAEVKYVIGKDGLKHRAYDPTYRLQDHVLSVKKGGIEYHITLQPGHERIARAMKLLDVEHGNEIIQGMGAATRIFAGLATRWNPAFPPFNLVRDAGGMLVTFGGEHGFLRAARAVANIPRAMRAIASELRSPGGAGKWNSRYRDFVAAGGLISYLDLNNIHEEALKVQKALGHARSSPPMKLLRRIGAILEACNDVVENGTRLAVYSAGIDAGWSVGRAAEYAKGITTNFETKGEIGPWLNALWAFGNAGVQGINRHGIEAMKASGVRRAVAAGVTFAAGWAFVVKMLMDDDDWRAIPEWEKGQNLIIPAGSGNYVTVPLPFVFRWWHYTGWKIGELAMGDVSPLGAAGAVTAGLMDEINPLGGSSHPAQAISPTALDPFVDLWINKNFAGKSIYPESYPGQIASDATLTWPDTASSYKALARWMNQATGGDEIEGGLVDLHPESIEHLVRFVLSGTGATLDRVKTVLEKAADPNQAVAREDVPILRRFWRHQSPYFIDNEYRSVAKAIAVAEKRDELSPLARKAGALKVANKRIKRVEEQIEKADGPEREAELRERIRRIKSTLIDRVLAVQDAP